MRIYSDCLSPVVTLLYRAWIHSLRFDDGGGLSRITEVADSGRSVILSFWHAELFALGGYGMRFMPGRLATLVSESRDGELIAQIVTRIGYGTVRGSSSRSGLKALMGLKKHLEQGRIVVLTVDGPRGPRHKVKDGAVYLAHHTGALLFPVRSQPRTMHEFKGSWDHFQLPRPFTRCQVLFGQPLEFLEAKATSEMLVREGLRLEGAMHSTITGAE
jgi:lysophospholipid acyltransferase (LPLAT)-like uncharacterized protein